MSIQGPPLIDLIAASMSVRSLQHQVIASNIANRDTAGYQRMKVQFERLMGSPQAPTVAVDNAGTNVPLEQDLVALSANSGQYQALARMLNRYFAIISTITHPSRG